MRSMLPCSWHEVQVKRGECIIVRVLSVETRHRGQWQAVGGSGGGISVLHVCGLLDTDKHRLDKGK